MIHTRIYLAEGIVIKRRNFGEVDRMLTVFTNRYGKLRIIAKGVRKISSRRSGHVELFSQLRMTLHSSQSHDTLTEASAIRSGEMFAENLLWAGCAYYVCELIDKLVPDTQEHNDVYQLLIASFDQITAISDAEESRIFMEQFANTLLRILGFTESSKFIPYSDIESYIEHIIERKLHTMALLTKINS